MTSTLAAERYPPVGIVLVNWNNWRDCVENLDSLLALKYPNFGIFLIDNDSEDGSIGHILSWCEKPLAHEGRQSQAGVERWTTRRAAQPISCAVVDGNSPPSAPPPEARVILIRSPGNLGFAGGNNLAIRCAGLERFEYFWLLNTDTVVDAHALDALVERALRDPEIGMVGSTVLYYDRPQIVQALGGAHLNPASASSRHLSEGQLLSQVTRDVDTIERDLTYIFGASMLVSSRLIREIGPMREDYFLYYEEIDWAMRSRSRFKLGYAPYSYVFHKSGASSSKKLSGLSAGYYYRNMLRFMSRFYPQHLGAVKTILLRDLLRLTLRGQWSRARLLVSILLQANDIAAQAAATRELVRT